VIDEEYKAVETELAQFLPRLKGKIAAIFLGATHMADLVKTFEDLGMEVVFTGSRFGDAANYKDAWQMVKPGSYIVDDPSERDLEYLLCELRPDVFVGTVKEQPLSHKFGIGLCPLQTGAYIGFKGFSSFARSVYKAVYAPVWHFLRGEMA
jgi:nitrogenase molybdenum-iron protein alpha/beta subunit